MRENDLPAIEPDLSQGPFIREALRLGRGVATELVHAGVPVDADQVEYAVASVLVADGSDVFC